jgi:hypothetical protein
MVMRRFGSIGSWFNWLKEKNQDLDSETAQAITLWAVETFRRLRLLNRLSKLLKFTA